MPAILTISPQNKTHGNLVFLLGPDMCQVRHKLQQIRKIGYPSMVLSSLNLYFIHKFFVLYWKFYTPRNTTLRV